MDENPIEDKVLLPHHVQQELCTTRLPYRQGRKLTAVKVYTINDESRHLLIFGVPSLNLRQETKAQFMRFGKLLQFTISKDHETEKFTETYHAVYERIQSARYAKKMMDTKNYYGGILHVTYAPEFELVTETRQKLLQRKKDVAYRLNNLKNEAKTINDNTKAKVQEDVVSKVDEIGPKILNKLNMREINEISIGKQPRDVIKKLKRKYEPPVIEKRFKPCFVEPDSPILNQKYVFPIQNSMKHKACTTQHSNPGSSKNNYIEIIDLSKINKEVVTNIYESLNYDKFGSEIIKNVPKKPLNVITFKNK